MPQARIAEPNIKPPPELLAAIDPATNDVAETEELTPEVKIFIVQALADFDLLLLRPMRPVVTCRHNTAPVETSTFRI